MEMLLGRMGSTRPHKGVEFSPGVEKENQLALTEAPTVQLEAGQAARFRS
jgi:hypothetical protein